MGLDTSVELWIRQPERRQMWPVSLWNTSDWWRFINEGRTMVCTLSNVDEFWVNAILMLTTALLKVTIKCISRTEVNCKLAFSRIDTKEHLRRSSRISLSLRYNH